MMDYKIGEMFEIDRIVFQVIGNTSITSMSDGHPFTYPAVLLENTETKATKVIPSGSMDMIAKFFPEVDMEFDAYDKFVEYFESATKGKYTTEIKSYTSVEYQQYRTTIEKVTQNFNTGFSGGKLSERSITILRQFAMTLLLIVEMSAKKKEKTNA